MLLFMKSEFLHFKAIYLGTIFGFDCQDRNLKYQHIVMKNFVKPHTISAHLDNFYSFQGMLLIKTCFCQIEVIFFLQISYALCLQTKGPTLYQLFLVIVILAMFTFYLCLQDKHGLHGACFQIYCMINLKTRTCRPAYISPLRKVHCTERYDY